MNTVGVIAKFEAKPGTEQEMERFFSNGVAIVKQQPASTMWFAFRAGPTTYGAFATFASETDRSSLLSAGGPKLAEEFAALFTSPPTFEMVSILESRPDEMTLPIAQVVDAGILAIKKTLISTFELVKWSPVYDNPGSHSNLFMR